MSDHTAAACGDNGLELDAYAALRGFAVCAAGAARRCGDDDALPPEPRRMSVPCK